MKISETGSHVNMDAGLVRRGRTITTGLRAAAKTNDTVTHTKTECIMICNETYVLSNGVQIPKLGFGTWFIDDDKVAGAVRRAVKTGYRHIDTAQAYGNERGSAKVSAPAAFRGRTSS